MLLLGIAIGVLSVVLLCTIMVLRFLSQLQKQWYEENAPLGRALGYPECCIREFCRDEKHVLQVRGIIRQKFGLGHVAKWHYERFQASHINGNYSGFIPCIKHAKQIHAGEITLAELVQNRAPDFPPFPDYAPQDEFFQPLQTSST